VKRTRKALGIIFAALLTSVAAAQQPALTAEQIVANMAARNAQRAARLQGYQSTRFYELDYSGFPGSRHATMTVRVNFVAPKKEFTIVSLDGSKLLQDRVLRRLIETEKEADNDKDRAATALNGDNYDFKLLGVEYVALSPAEGATPPSTAANMLESTPAGRRCYVLQVIPKRNHKLLYRGTIWVDAHDFAVARIAAGPAKNPSFWISSTEIEHQYGKHGEFWLPATNRSVTKVRLGGRATLTINYGQYENIRAE
jgi:hypothetical protein